MTGSKRPRLFAFSRETELAHVHLWVQNPQEQQAVEAAVDAFIEVTRTRRLAEENLATIVSACASDSDMLRTLAITRLVILTHYFELAREAYEQLAAHENPKVRQFITSGLLNAPSALQTLLAPTMLADPDPDVREAAVPVNASHPAHITARLEVESDAKVRRALERALKA